MAQPVSGLGARLRAALGIDGLEKALSTDREDEQRRESARACLRPGQLPAPPPPVSRDLGID